MMFLAATQQDVTTRSVRYFLNQVKRFLNDLALTSKTSAYSIAAMK